MRLTPLFHPTRRGRRTVSLAAVAAMCAMALAACGSGTSTASSGSGSASGGHTYTFGLITANTGPVAFAGKSFSQGVELAVQTLNSEGFLGAGNKIKLAEKEGASDPARNVTAAKQLAADSSVMGIICCILSPVAGAVKPIAQSSQLPMDIYGATDIGLENPPYVYRTATLPQFANEQLAKSIAAQKHPSSVAYVVTSDNSGMKSQLSYFQKAFNAAGVKDLGTVNTLASQTDFSGPAAQVLSKHPDVVVVSCLQTPEAAMIKALRDRGYKGLIAANVTISSPGVYKANSSSIVGVPFPTYFAPSLVTNPTAQAFVKAYKAKFGEAPDTYAAQAYNGMYVMAAALKKAPDKTRSGLTDALSKMTSLSGTIYGTVTFQNGQMHADQTIKDVQWAQGGTLASWRTGA